MIKDKNGKAKSNLPEY